MEKVSKETLGISVKLVAKAESKNMKLTKRILVDDLKMIKVN